MNSPTATTSAMYGYRIDWNTGRKMPPSVHSLSFKWNHATSSRPKNPPPTHANPHARRRHSSAPYHTSIAYATKKITVSACRPVRVTVPA